MVHHLVSKNAADRSIVLGLVHRARDVNYSRKSLSRNTTAFKMDETGISDLNQYSRIS